MSGNKQRRKHFERIKDIMSTGRDPYSFDNNIVRLSGMTDMEVAQELAFGPVALGPVEPPRSTGWFGSLFGNAETPTVRVQEEFDYLTSKKNDSHYVSTDFKSSIDVHISEEIYLRLVKMVQELGKDSLEIGGLLKIKRENNQLLVTDYCLLPQRVGGADFVISEETMAGFIMEHMLEPDFADWRGWFHSHHSMGLFWSGTDNDMFRKLLDGNQVFKDTFGIVFVNSGNFLARYDVRTPFGDVVINDLSVSIERAEQAPDIGVITTEMQTLISENVTRPVRASYEYGGYGNRAYVDDLDEARTYVTDNDVWNGTNYPHKVTDLVELLGVHQKVLPDWTFEKECSYWGIDAVKAKARIEALNVLAAERAEKQKEQQLVLPVTPPSDGVIFGGRTWFKGQWCGFCDRDNVSVTFLDSIGEDVCYECFRGNNLEEELTIGNCSNCLKTQVPLVHDESTDDYYCADCMIKVTGEPFKMAGFEERTDNEVGR